MNPGASHYRSSVGLQVLIALAHMFFWFATDVHASEFTVDSWLLSTGIGGPGPQDIDLDGTTTVTNPLVRHFETSLGESSTSMDVNMSWNESVALGRFLIESTISAEGISPSSTLLSAGTTGRIVITPLVPITVLIHAEYTFDLPVDHIHTSFDFSATGVTSQSLAFNEHHGFSTTMGPGLGTFTIDGQFILPPTETWRLLGIMDIDMLSGTEGYLGTGSGFFDIQIVPEPTTLFLITAMLPFLCRPRR